MLFKKIIIFHIIPIIIASVITHLAINSFLKKDSLDYSFSLSNVRAIKFVDKLSGNNLNNELAFSFALKKRIPILFGSSELTSHHLDGLATNFFNKDSKKDLFFSIGHAGFQSFAILSALAANKSLLKKFFRGLIGSRA